MLTKDTVLQQRYRIIRHLGQGGMGSVYQATDERLNKTVAVKEVTIESSDDTQRGLIQMAFQREADSLVKAKHEAVPDITDYFSESGGWFLVMEFVEGEDLAKLLEKRGRPFKFEDVSSWIYQLLDALEFLHGLVPPIIHRDIKPQNLKLNDRQKIKLLDFGIARSSDKSSPVTQGTFLAATLDYAPLEQVLRVIAPMFREFVLLKHREKAEVFLQQDTDARCDVFGAGATFYHLLTNRAPVDVTQRALGIWERGVDELVRPSDLNPELPPGVSEWLMKAMAFERDGRFSSAREMKEALQRVSAGLSTIETNLPGVTGDQKLSQAQTELLIIPPDTAGQIPSNTGSVPKPGPDVSFEVTERFSADDIPRADLPVTGADIAVPAETIGASRGSYLKTDMFPKPPIDERPAPAVVASAPARSTNPNRKYVVALAVIAVLIVAVSGVGLYAAFTLWNRERTIRNDNSGIEVTNLQPSPESTPVASQSATPADGNSESNIRGMNPANTETTPANPADTTTPTPAATRPVVQPTGTAVPVRTPTRTPTPARTPTPTPRPTVAKTPVQSGAQYYAVCYIKAPDGTITKVRKNKCSECPKDTACELVFK